MLKPLSLLLLTFQLSTRCAFAQTTPDAIFAAASPAVVKLTVKDEDDREIGTGSGFVVAFHDLSDGLGFTSTIITNNHVVYPAVEIDILFQDKGTGKASQVLVEAPSTDIAVLTVWSSAKPGQVLKLCDGESPAIGTKVFTIGSPLGFTNTLSEGLVSGYRERDDGSRWMQISAAISSGSSGGPVLSSDGCVLGMTTATTKEGQNLNFAILASDIHQALNGLKKPRPVWEGASIRRIEQEVTYQLLNRVIDDCVGGSQAERLNPSKELKERASQESVDRCLAKKVEDGNQVALLRTGWGFQTEERDDEAGVMLRRAADAKPGDFAYLAHYWLASALSNPGEGKRIESDEVIHSLKKAKELRPDFAPVRYRLGEIYYMQSKYPEALLEAEAVVQLLPRSYQAYMLRGTVWARLGRKEAFERDFAETSKLHAEDVNFCDQKGQAYQSLGEVEKAFEAFQESISLNPRNEWAHYQLAKIAAQQNRCDVATEHYKLFMEISKSVVPNPYGLWDEIAACKARTRHSP